MNTRISSQQNDESERVTKMFTDAGHHKMIDVALMALANGTPADDLGTMAVALAYDRKEGIDFCPLFRGEYQQVSDVVSCTEDEYVEMRCKEEGFEYHA